MQVLNASSNNDDGIIKNSVYDIMMEMALQLVNSVDRALARILKLPIIFEVSWL